MSSNIATVNKWNKKEIQMIISHERSQKRSSFSFLVILVIVMLKLICNSLITETDQTQKGSASQNRENEVLLADFHFILYSLHLDFYFRCDKCNSWWFRSHCLYAFGRFALCMTADM
jgi:hypothetical protein